MDNDQHQAMLNQILHVVTLLVNVIFPAAFEIIKRSYSKEPYHTSILTGQGWVQELRDGHPDRIRTELGVSKDVFRKLIFELYDMGHRDLKGADSATLEEQLAIFLYTCVTGLTIRHVGERFQRSNASISKHFKKMSEIFSSPPFYTKYVQQRTPNDPPDHHFLQNKKFWPFFSHCLGAADGSHIRAWASAQRKEAFLNWKGFYSQNCLFCCSFNLLFTYLLTGMEGSASDAFVWSTAIAPGSDLIVPDGWYYLADSGYPHCKELLVPYAGKRYHLAEWGRAGVRPKDREELFNLRHAQARNVIERIFGVLKRRFRILLLAPEYENDVQAQIVTALCAIHNFIRIHNRKEGTIPSSDEDWFQGGGGIQNAGDVVPRLLAGFTVNPADVHYADARRDHIAQEMWDDYLAAIEGKGYEVNQFLFSTEDDAGDNHGEHVEPDTYDED